MSLFKNILKLLSAYGRSNKFIYLVFFFFQSMALAQIDSAKFERSQISSEAKRCWASSLNYISWQEALTLQNPSISDHAWSNFFGNSLNVSYENSWGQSLSRFYLLEAGIISGLASAGGSQNILTYQQSNINWTGFTISPRFLYNLSPQVGISLGPYVLYRSISYPTTSSGVSASSGSLLNEGLYAEAREVLWSSVQIQQGLGWLALNSSVLWNLGLGYRF
jgi:hypothetical protein